MSTQQQTIPGGVVHALPTDLRAALVADTKALGAWKSITPLARNEWICWTISVKQQKTRDAHVVQAISKLNKGMRRPCCWVGCTHRPDKALSPTQKWVTGR
ncbi:MAG TPA: YdeI/OmpD-associated family protein [Candidatus Saccharimonadales bacterium]|nr:YdeI/OmpD-associated family protein [Candidatus Saccharimonadales bacterium]